jgi:hypothetical protein
MRRFVANCRQIKMNEPLVAWHAPVTTRVEVDAITTRVSTIDGTVKLLLHILALAESNRFLAFITTIFPSTIVTIASIAHVATRVMVARCARRPLAQKTARAKLQTVCVVVAIITAARRAWRTTSAGLGFGAHRVSTEQGVRVCLGHHINAAMMEANASCTTASGVVCRIRSLVAQTALTTTLLRVKDQRMRQAHLANLDCAVAVFPILVATFLSESDLDLRVAESISD